MARLQDIEVPDFKEPKLGSHTKGNHTIIMGKGTVGLGRRYAPAFEQLQRDVELTSYLDSVERRREEAAARKRAQKRQALHIEAAEERREARRQYLEKKDLELRKMEEMRMMMREEAQAEERARREQLDKRARYLRDTKANMKRQNEDAKEEQRREFEHQRLERLEAQAKERREHHERRLLAHEELQSKVKRLRADAQRSQQQAIEVVSDLKQKQREEAAEGKNDRANKISHRRREIEEVREFNERFAATQRDHHKRKMQKLSDQHQTAVYERKLTVKKELPEETAITAVREARFEEARQRVLDAREKRRARSALEATFNIYE